MTSADQEPRDLIREAIALDARGQPADSLYLPGATIIANGRVRAFPPRLAGIGRAGTVLIASISVEVSGNRAWGTAAYQWVSADGSARELGRATLLLQRAGSAWRITHVHSSQVLPWDTGPP